jgi:DeoR/GlpR family transcriptional regulator of sugar metabolism
MSSFATHITQIIYEQGQVRIRRLCAEALAQGAEPTIVELAEVLGVTGRTVDRDITSLRAAGELVTTRGASARAASTSLTANRHAHTITLTRDV